MIPGQLVSLLTFPGVIIHEWAHKKFCDWLNIPVIKVVYFSFFKNPAGYVIHQKPKTYKETFWISVGPLILNSVLTLVLGLIAANMPDDGWSYILIIWLALSIGMHSFPSDGDMEHISYASKIALGQQKSFLHYLAFPFVWIIWIANKLRFFWFDFIYAVLLISLVGGF